MSGKKRRSKDNIDNLLENNVIEHSDEDENENNNSDVTEMIFVPEVNDDSDLEEADEEDDTNISSNNGLPNLTRYEEVYANYTEKMKKLESCHVYKWLDGEKQNDFDPKIEIINFNNIKETFSDQEPVKLFECFFSKEMKSYIIDATKENNLEIDIDKFDGFLGISIFSIINTRKCYRDYWSEDKLLHSEIVSNVMPRNEFEEIKSKIKTSKNSDKNDNDRVWKIRKILDMFCRNIQLCGFFSSAMSVDEMMVKFHGRSVLKQFMRNKPIRFGIKLWALCTSNGFLLNLDVYCGKNGDPSDQKLSQCALGSRVVVKILQHFLMVVNEEEMPKYHVYFDNFFTSPDLLVHLIKQNLRATGTVRDNRVFTKDMFADTICANSNNQNRRSSRNSKKITNPEQERLIKKHKISKKCHRGTYVVSHEESSGMNYVSVLDSKQVSILSTASGLEPFKTLERYDKIEKKKIPINFPKTFEVYNKFMGGVDLHDQHCSDLEIHIGGKKWTWSILRRLIQSSLTNGLVIYNMVHDKKISAKDFAISVARVYLNKNLKGLINHLQIQIRQRRRICVLCPAKTKGYCYECKEHFCQVCFIKYHISHKILSQEKPKVCKASTNCIKITIYFCAECDKNICLDCYLEFHQNLEKNI